MKLELLEKTEIWIKPIRISEANLSLIAEKVAEILHLDNKEVLVVDVREDLITLDILKKSVRAEDIIGKKNMLLTTLSQIPGVFITPETELHSEGILGLIDIEDPKTAGEILDGMERMRCEVSDRLQKRAIVFPSGFEIQEGMIVDTNTPYIKNRLMQAGFNVRLGNALDDELESIVLDLRIALNQGYGLIITTGGVGAENKDRMVEALIRLDPDASTPYIVRYEKGTGRHEKDGVKIGVAYVRPSLIIALPGPHEEVKVGMEVIVEGLRNGIGKTELAATLSNVYIRRLKSIHHFDNPTEHFS